MEKRYVRNRVGCLVLGLAVLGLIVFCMTGTVLAKYAGDVKTGEFHINVTENEPFSYVLQYMDGENEVHTQQEKDQKKSHVCIITDMIPKRAGYMFLGWAVKPDGKAADFKAGDSLTLHYVGDRKMTIRRELYAVWRPAVPILETGKLFNAHTPAETSAVIFTDAKAPEGTELTDVSEAKNGGIMAWLEDTIMYVSTQQTGFPAYANPDSSRMFYQKKNITGIDTTNLDTSICRNMAQMFFECSSMRNVDVSRFDTSNVTDIAGLFYCCYALEAVDVSGWDTSNITNMRFVFAGVQSNNMALKSVGDLSNWNTAKVTTASYMFQNCANLERIGDLGEWDTSAMTIVNGMFYKCRKLVSVGDLSRWDTSKMTTMSAVFGECCSLKDIGDLSNWNTGKVTAMSGFFYNCFQLTDIGNLDNWNVSNVTDMSHMFSGYNNSMMLENIGDLSNWDTSKVTSFNCMFQNCSGLKDIGDLSRWKTGRATTMERMFSNCSGLKDIGDLSNWDTGSVTSFRSMFSGHDYIGDMQLKPTWVSAWNVSNCTNFSYMFYGCGQLEDLDLSNWDVSKATTFRHTFCDNFKLSSITFGTDWDTSHVTDFNGMFNDCRTLTSLDLSMFDTRACTDFGQMFESCCSLTEIKGLENFNTGNGEEFYQMFRMCSSMKSFDLSSFDTSKGKYFAWMFQGCASLESLDLSTFDTAKAEALDDNDKSGFYLMFSGCTLLEQVTVSEKWSWEGNGTCTNTDPAALDTRAILPTQSDSNIPNADGKWYNTSGQAFLPDALPNHVADIYCAVRTDVKKKKKQFTSIADYAIMQKCESSPYSVNGNSDLYLISHIQGR